MVLAQKFFIHPGPVIISLDKAFRYDLHQIGIPFVILRQQHKMIIPVVTARHFPVKSGIRRHIDFTPQDRFDPLGARRSVEIDHTVHHTVICDRGAVHSQLFDPRDIFFNLIGSVQQTVLCMDMQVHKTHGIRHL